jgi:hypothetical protein
LGLANCSSLALSGEDEWVIDFDIVHIMEDLALDEKIPSLTEIDGSIFAIQNTYEDCEQLMTSAHICKDVECIAALLCEDGA